MEKIKGFKIIRLFIIILLVFSFSSQAFVLAAANKFKITPVGDKSPHTVSFNYGSNEEMLKSMDMIASNKSFEMYINKSDLCVAVLDKKTGEIYTTNPSNAASEPSYTGQIKKLLDSQIVVSYSKSGGKSETLWSSSDCVELGQYEIKKTASGASVLYSIGVEKSSQLVPQIMSAERFDEIIDFFTQKDNSKAVRRLKVLYREGNFTDGTKIYSAKKLNEKEIIEVEEYFTKAGYTEKELDADNKKFKVDSSDKFFPNFQITLEYNLTDKGFNITIPAEKIKYDRKNFNLLNIKVLEYFGAVSANENHSGYVLLPDGSGTILPFENKNDSTRQAMISGQVYGYDSAISYPVIPRQGEQYYLPVFGLKKDNSGYFAIISEGDGMSSISGYAGNQYGSYYTAFTTFSMTTREEQELEQKVATHGSKTTVTVCDSNEYSGNCTVEYTLLNEKNNSYTGMAEIYREYLSEKGAGTSEKTSQNFLTLETVGTLSYIDKFLGMEYVASPKLTTFEDNIEILESLNKNGIDNISLILKAWRKGGLDCGIANKFDPAAALGGKSEFKNLRNWCADKKIDFFPDYNLIFVPKDSMFDGFAAGSDSSRLLNDKFAGLLSVRADTSMYDKATFKYALSPDKYSKNFNKLLKSYNKTNVNSLGFSSVGEYLNSNFNESNKTNRQQTIDILTKLLSNASEDNKIMFAGANAYTLPFASLINNVPLQSSNFKGTVQVPFIQLALKGLVKYSSTEINYADDYNTAILKCIESASSPHFVLAKDNIIKIKQTDYTEYYSISYDAWFGSVVEYYNQYEKAIAPVENANIIEHKYIAKNIVKVNYSNGYNVFVNYSDSEFTYENTIVPPKSSITVKG